MDHGWPTTGGASPWLPFPPDAATRNYETQRQDPSSILHLYRRLIQHRRRSPALALGTFEPVELPEGILGYRRDQEGDGEVVVVNFTDRGIELADRTRALRMRPAEPA